MSLFLFRKQPLKTIYVIGVVFYTLASIPVLVIKYALPSQRPRRTWTLKRALTVHLVRSAVGKLIYGAAPILDPPLESYKKDAKRIVSIEPTPDLVVGEIRELAEKNGVKPEKLAGFWLGPTGPDGVAGQRARPEERVVMHLHGGAHIMGGAHSSSSTGPCYQGYLEHFGPNIRVFVPEYRLASTAPFPAANPFPASLLDAIASYRYLVQDVGFEPHQIILAGDSAGGGIALNLARYLATANLPGLPQAGGLLLLSPTMDWGRTYADDPDSCYSRNAKADFVEGVMESGYTPRALCGPALPLEFAKTSAWISPGSRVAEWAPEMFAGLPRTLIVAGAAEQTLDGMRTIRERLVKAMGEEKVVYIEVPDVPHDLFLMSWCEPERTETLVRTGEWVRSL
ncbi:alpha/beta-hydrolase [Cubamyces sp. BRFM 1775]|nr:alpha/beta-hydrolase [Cubamyces sp. BRFM 1775]